MHHSYPGGSLGKSLDLPKRQETIVSGYMRRGDSEHCLNELQRWAQAAAISADPRDRHETIRLLLPPPRSLCEHRSLSTPPLLGTSAARHCQGPVIRGQLPRENTRHASGCCNVTHGLCCRRLTPHSIPLPLPSLSEAEPPNHLLL